MKLRSLFFSQPSFVLHIPKNNMLVLLVFLIKNHHFMAGGTSCSVGVTLCKLHMTAVWSSHISEMQKASWGFPKHKSSILQSQTLSLGSFLCSKRDGIKTIKFSRQWSTLLHLPDSDFSILFASSAEDVAILSGAERHHLVVVAVELLQDLVMFGAQDVNLPFGRTAADTADPHLVFNFDHAVTAAAVLESHTVDRFVSVLKVPNTHFSGVHTNTPELLPLR